jgi:hypothetical protein
VARAIHAHAPQALGMSYEIADAKIEDMRAETWKLTRVTFTGAAILLRDKAAYRGTSFRMTQRQPETTRSRSQLLASSS